MNQSKYRIDPTNNRVVQKAQYGRWWMEKRHGTPQDAVLHLKKLQEQEKP
jgi:hypothetical protein